jgi:hypothetical protein
MVLTHSHTRCGPFPAGRGRCVMRRRIGARATALLGAALLTLATIGCVATGDRPLTPTTAGGSTPAGGTTTAAGGGASTEPSTAGGSTPAGGTTTAAGGGASTEPSTAEGSTPAGGTTTAAGQSQVVNPPGPPEAGGPSQPEGLPAWLPIGPADPGDPPPEQWYPNAQNGDCEAMTNAGADRDPLWGTVAALCRAVTGDPASWPQVLSGFQGLARPPEQDCLGRAGYDLIAAWIGYFQRNPWAALPSAPESTGGGPVIIDVPPSPPVPAAPGTACVLVFTGLISTDLGLAPPEPSPTAGIEGGQRFRLGGRLLDPVVVLFGEARIDAQFTGPNRFEFEIPPAQGPGPVTIRVESRGQLLPGEATLNYTGTPSTTASSPGAEDSSAAAESPAANSSPGLRMLLPLPSPLPLPSASLIAR